MTVFISIVFTILVIIGGGILGYIIFEYFKTKGEFEKTPVSDIFWTEYHKAKREREAGYK